MEPVMAKGPALTNEDKLEMLVSKYQLSLLRLCYAYLHDQQLAEDAVQETFIKAYRALVTFRGGSSEKTWMMKIAANTCRDMLRTGWFRYVDRKVDLDKLPETPVPWTDQDNSITEAVMELPFRLREVVLMYYFQGLSEAETAEVLGISRKGVASRLRRAKEKLKKELEEKGCDLL